MKYNFDKRIDCNSHDYIADLHAQSHGKKFKTFKEWNSQVYSRIVQDMIGYANYVDKQRKDESDEGAASTPEPINFEKGPGGLPLLPSEVKGVRGMEVAKNAKEIIRAYFLRHYRKLPQSIIGLADGIVELATGSDTAKTPWAIIGEDPSRFFDLACLPSGFKFQDPSRMGVHIKDLLNHLRERRLTYGVKAFHFHHVLHNGNQEAAQYNDEPKPFLEGNEMTDSMKTDSDGIMVGTIQTSASPIGTPTVGKRRTSKSPRKRPSKGKGREEDPSGTPLPATASSGMKDSASVKMAQPVLHGALPFNLPGPSNQMWAAPHSGTSALSTHDPFFTGEPDQSLPSLPLPQSNPLTIPPHPYLPFPFPYPQQYLAYLLQNQGNLHNGGGFPIAPKARDPPPPNIDPTLLPPGQPVFSLPQVQFQSWPQSSSYIKEPDKDEEQTPEDTPRRKSTRTPKRKRSLGLVVDDTPTRSLRKRKQK